MVPLLVFGALVAAGYYFKQDDDADESAVEQQAPPAAAAAAAAKPPAFGHGQSKETRENFSLFSQATNRAPAADVYHSGHNNMQPFIKDSQAPSMYYRERPAGFAPEMDPATRRAKVELPETFRDIHDNSKAALDPDRARYVAAPLKTSEKPFQPVRVGPGVTHDYESRGRDGFHSKTRVLPNVDTGISGNERVARAAVNNAVRDGAYKVPGTHGCETVAPKDLTAGRDAFATSRAAGERETYRSDFSPLHTQRATTDCQAYMPHANQPTAGTYTAGDYASERSEHGRMTEPVGVATGRARPNERTRDMFAAASAPGGADMDLSEMALPAGNVQVPGQASARLSRQAPMERASRKEYLTASKREATFVQSVRPPKQTVYDPREGLRTTLRETAIHDTHDGMLRVVPTNEAHYSEALIRTTGRETFGALAGADGDGRVDAGAALPSKPPVYDPNDILETTHRETTLSDGRLGLPQTTASAHGYMTSEMEAPGTQRADVSTHQYFGGATDTNGDGYLTQTGTHDVRATHRQDHEQYTGAALSASKAPRSTGEIYARAMTDMKESVLALGDPRGGRETLASGVDTVDCVRLPQNVGYEAKRAPNRQGANDQTAGWSCRAVSKWGDEVHDDRLQPYLVGALQTNEFRTKMRL